MAMRCSLDMGNEAKRLERAVESVLAKGIRTADLAQLEGQPPVSTIQMGNAIIDELTLSCRPDRLEAEVQKTRRVQLTVRNNCST